MLVDAQSLGDYEFLSNVSLNVPNLWCLSKRHFKVQVFDRRFVKLKKFRSRINKGELKMFCVEFTPLHVYFSVF